MGKSPDAYHVIGSDPKRFGRALLALSANKLSFKDMDLTFGKAAGVFRAPSYPTKPHTN